MLRLPLSIAASWAWGTSLIVGMQIAQTKGLTAWFIWATANCLTLALFGLLTRTRFLTRDIFQSRLVKWSAIAIQIFCLVIQLNILNTIALNMGASPIVAYTFATSIGVIFTVWMYKHGLITSIITDKWQAILTAISLVLIITLGLVYNVPIRIHPDSTWSDVVWGMWSACILFSGPIGDIQHYQRAEVAGKTHAFTIAALVFAVYMLLVLTMSFFEFNDLMNAILIFAVICVTSSTIDSIAVALHEISNKQVGTIIALIICVFWGVFASVGIIELWSNAGVFRVLFALAIVGYAYKILKAKQ